jgi:hypothetical protein
MFINECGLRMSDISDRWEEKTQVDINPLPPQCDPVYLEEWKILMRALCNYLSQIGKMPRQRP